ncbi:hypothetical protein FLONG3_4194 [Fusarium longipes]|uniref:Protein kinase domain-containing protein n=1 Tax=Fusarium longipes TaxID=694270 RepID=A0A395SYQ5_9HYPO|nr:hypothetical protein FLONG3_4194 [Fusarium longipes]
MQTKQSTDAGIQLTAPHSPSPQDEEPMFEILRKVEDNVWIVTRRGDPRKEEYLASPSPFGVRSSGTINTAQDLREADALRNLLLNHNQAHTVRQILNHENLLSIVGVMQYQIFTKQQTPDAQGNNVELLVWDFADAGNLSALFRHYPVEHSSFYLPEPLCWHVLRSMMRAVTWLHDGKRLVYQHKSGDPEDTLVKYWLTINTDWFSILHRAIEPKNIWFQHPRGTETYGQCKLGDFSTAAVTCHAVDGRNESKEKDIPTRESAGTALATRGGLQSLEVAREALEGGINLAGMDEVDRPYTLRDEIWSIGATVFTMMTGQAPSHCCEQCGCCHVRYCESGGCLERDASAKGCECLCGGCEHIPEGDECNDSISYWPDCPPRHNCTEVTINIHSWLARTRYSKYLRDTVRELLQYDPNGPLSAGGHLFRMWKYADALENAYQEWKAETKEGQDYVDIDDDMTERLRSRH